jgi:hypothetical protein
MAYNEMGANILTNPLGIHIRDSVTIDKSNMGALADALTNCLVNAPETRIRQLEERTVEDS